MRLRKLSINFNRQICGKRKGKINIMIAFPFKEDGEWYMNNWFFVKLPF